MPFMNTWRWISGGSAGGASQMATDKAILEHASDLGKPTMRVYFWKPYCISLGYHQAVQCIDIDRCRKDTIDVVRRPTGGRAVLHAEEVTYSVIIPRKHAFFSQNISDVYNKISVGLCAGIQKLGIPARLEKHSIDLHSHYRSSLSASCFSAAARNEILVDGKKLVGSAQRNGTEGILQHGSILVDDAHLNLPEYLTRIPDDEKKNMKAAIAGKTVTIRSFLKKKISYPEIVAGIRSGMEDALHIEFEEGDLTAAEKTKAAFLINEFVVLENKDEQ
jgi:lipoate-protein ligase A